MNAIVKPLPRARSMYRDIRDSVRSGVPTPIDHLEGAEAVRYVKEDCTGDGLINFLSSAINDLDTKDHDKFEALLSKVIGEAYSEALTVDELTDLADTIRNAVRASAIRSINKRLEDEV